MFEKIVFNLCIVILYRSPWIIPVAISCTLFIILLISGAIVLGLIPIYLSSSSSSSSSNNNVDTSDSMFSIVIFQVLRFDVSFLDETSFNTMYTSDVVNGRLLTISNTNDLYSQVLFDIF